LNDENSKITKTGKYENLVFNIIPNSSNLISYNDKSKKMKIFEINFPILSNNKIFLEDSSFLNINGKLYICGGSLPNSNTSSNQFLIYDPQSDKMKIIKDLNETRRNHSMIYHEDKIYIVGGETCKTTEILETINKTFDSKINNKYEPVDNPILYIHKNFLYSFFGKKNGKFIEFVQRANLNTDKMIWEKIAFKLEDEKINLKLTNSAIIPFGESEIFFFGGINENGITNEVLSFDFNDKQFKSTDIVLDEAHFFNNSQFDIISQNVYSSFSSNEKENLIKVTVDLREI